MQNYIYYQLVAPKFRSFDLKLQGIDFYTILYFLHRAEQGSDFLNTYKFKRSESPYPSHSV